MIKKVLLAGACVVLLLMCGLLVVFLQGGDAEPETEEPWEPAPVMPASAPPVVKEPVATRAAPPPPPPPARAAPARPLALPPVLRTQPLAVAPMLKIAPLDRSGVQVEITGMRKVTPPRIDPRSLNKQTQHLADALADAKRSGSWSRARIRQVERQLRSLKLNELQNSHKSGKGAAPLRKRADEQAERQRVRALERGGGPPPAQEPAHENDQPR